MTFNILTTKLTYRKLKISDYKNFKKLFYSTFKKKISFDFFKWRYFNDKSSFCYGAFDSKKLIANVGMVATKLNNYKTETVFSRHSSMVLKKYRGLGIFSHLLQIVKEKIFYKASKIIMWPNTKNFSSFGINNNYIVKKKYYLYQCRSKINSSKKIKKLSINELYKLKNLININGNFFFKNFNDFKKRYLSYKKSEYFINQFHTKTLKSFFIIKRNKDKSGFNYVILDHFGSKKIFNIHLSYLKNNQKKLIFLSKKKINNKNYKLINYINFKIGFIHKSNIIRFKKSFFNNQIFLGDTDIFMSIN